MKLELLNNPIFASLNTRHREVALHHGEVFRYPPEIAPFIGFESDSLARESLDALAPPDHRLFFLGRKPAAPAGWSIQPANPLLQMVCDAPVPPVDGPPIVALDESHRPAVLALTALVYPHYFRAHTMALGRYVGIYVNGELAAMAGERMGMPGLREVSAVCTHPDFVGRGLARRLFVFLTNDLLARSEVAFLHVAKANQRAVRLYEQNGFRVRIDIPFWSMSRAP